MKLLLFRVRLRQTVAVKELLTARGKQQAAGGGGGGGQSQQSIRKTVSVPNFSNVSLRRELKNR